MNGRYWLETLGCPKNEVDSDKLAGTLVADGMVPAADPGQADLVVVNTCAFIEAARTESIETVLALAQRRRPGARLVVTGCMAERYGESLAEALPEVDLVAGFGRSLLNPPRQAGLEGVRVEFSSGPSPLVPDFDLLNLKRPPARAPWAYVKVAEGCDRHCGFCAIPSFRGRQRSRTVESILAEVDDLDVAEVVLVAQDLASYGRDLPGRDLAGRDSPGRDLPGPGVDTFGPQAGGEISNHDQVGGGRRRRRIIELVQAVSERVERVRLLYLYPSELDDDLIGTICATGVPYFDLSLQHVSRPLLRAMRRWGDGDRFAQRIEHIRALQPDAAFRSSFIVGYPGETEDDHDALLAFLAEVRLDWAGFFAYSAEEGTYAATLDAAVAPELMAERLGELSESQDRITAAKRADLIGASVRVLVDGPGWGRSHREAPDIDGVIRLPETVPVGSLVDAVVTEAIGPDLVADVVDRHGAAR
ncbi:MAG: MiaB/RimO family radical SAM methylthiotransferase [Acidimicrobiales bacterium]